LFSCRGEKQGAASQSLELLSLEISQQETQVHSADGLARIPALLISHRKITVKTAHGTETALLF
jgi:hypothetical protein